MSDERLGREERIPAPAARHGRKPVLEQDE
jgi:hypothetical protein